MDSILSECKEFQLIKTNICRRKARIKFLKTCKQEGILPKFTSIKCNTKSPSGLKAIQKAKREWLINELKRSYSEISTLDAKAYKNYLKIAYNLSSWQLDIFMEQIHLECIKYLSCYLKKQQKLQKLKENVVS